MGCCLVTEIPEIPEDLPEFDDDEDANDFDTDVEEIEEEEVRGENFPSNCVSYFSSSFYQIRKHSVFHKPGRTKYIAFCFTCG